MKHKIQVGVDPIIFTVFDDQLHVLLVRRNIEPFDGCWSLPGGLIDTELDLDVDAAAARKLKEKTGLDDVYLEQVCTVGSNARDPRNWSLSVAYFALIPKPDTILVASRGASEVRWEPVVRDEVRLPLAFDHAGLIKRAAERLRNKVSYTSVAAHLLPREFTLAELQRMHEILLATTVTMASITRRYVKGGLVEDAGKAARQGDTGRPAAVYRLKSREGIHVFVRSLEGPREKE